MAKKKKKIETVNFAFMECKHCLSNDYQKIKSITKLSDSNCEVITKCPTCKNKTIFQFQF